MALRFGECELDPDRFELRRNGEFVAIEPRAMRVLAELIEHRDRVVTKNELLDSVWGDRFVSESALTTQIKGLRRAVGDTGREQHIVKTVHTLGYMFVAPVHDDRDNGRSGGGDVDGRRAERISENHDDDRLPPLGPPDRTATDNGWRRGGNTTFGAGTAVSVSHDRPVVGVLPFANLSPDPERAHVASGLTHDVIAALSKHRWLRVLTAAATGGLRDQPEAVARLRDTLGAGYVVEGTVRLDGNRLRVTASLTDATEEVCIWADRFDREIGELFDVLDEITDVIVATVEPEVGYAERDRSGRRPRTDLRTWDLYHLGVAHFFRFTAEDNLEAQRLLDRCRELDPEFADAHAWWAYAVVLGMVYWDTDPDTETLDAALAATGEALRSDDHNAVFHMLRGRVRLARREYRQALMDNERAIELNPTFAAAFCGLGDSLCYEGRYDEAITQFERSVALGSHDPQRWAFLTYGALALLFAGRYDEALEWADRASALPNCQYWTTAHRAVALAQLARLDDAAAATRVLLEQCPQFSVDHARRKLFYLKRPEQVDMYLRGLRAAGVPDR